MKPITLIYGKLFATTMVVGLLFAGCGSAKTTMNRVNTDQRESVEQSGSILFNPPRFNGDLRGYLAENVRYPADAMKNNIQGRVVVEFIVEKDGSILEVKVLQSLYPSLDVEAIRVVKNMPNWIPGTQKGKPVRVSYKVPINFRLQ